MRRMAVSRATSDPVQERKLPSERAEGRTRPVPAQDGESPAEPAWHVT